MTASTDDEWMAYALSLAEKAEQQGEVPVGCVIVKDGQIIGEGWNQPITHNDPTAHAEISALRQACLNTNNYRLPGTTLYVTLEPCIMCAGAIVHARVERVVFASFEPKTGAAGSCLNIFDVPQLNHRVEYVQGPKAEESSLLLRNFFRARRKSSATKQ